MKSRLNFLLVIFFVMCSAFAQEKKISANGVTVPSWMINSTIINSEIGWGSPKTIGDILGLPVEGTKIKKLAVTGNNLHLEYYLGEKANESVIDLIVDFVCARLGESGTSYVSHIKVISRLTFEESEFSCDGPKDQRRYGKCLGALHSISSVMFIDEEKLAQQKAAEEQRKKEKEKYEAERKKEVYERELENALQDGILSLGFNRDNFEIKYSGALASTYLGINNSKIVVKTPDEDMIKAGFKKGDVVVNVNGFYLFNKSFSEYVESNEIRLSSSVSVDPYILENSVLTFTIKRSGKEIEITIPTFNPNSFKQFNEKFERDWKRFYQDSDEF